MAKGKEKEICFCGNPDCTCGDNCTCTPENNCGCNCGCDCGCNSGSK